MRSALISIKPKFVEQIRLGVKIFEFRKIVFTNVDKLYIYSSFPVKRVVAVCQVANIHCGSPDEIWKFTSGRSGISESFFYNYFNDQKKAFAIEMKNIEFFDQPKLLTEFSILRGPQSYQYINTIPR